MNHDFYLLAVRNADAARALACEASHLNLTIL